MPSRDLDASSLQVSLQTLAKKRAAWKAVFFALATRERSRAETTVEAIYRDTAKKLKDSELRSEVKRHQLDGIAAEGLERGTVEALLGKLAELDIGRFIQRHGNRKSRFLWQRASCQSVGKVALGEAGPELLAEEEDALVDSEEEDHTPSGMVDEQIAHVMDLRCIIRRPRDFKRGDRAWTSFLRVVQLWVEAQLEADGESRDS